MPSDPMLALATMVAQNRPKQAPTPSRPVVIPGQYGLGKYDSKKVQAHGKIEMEPLLNYLGMLSPAQKQEAALRAAQMYQMMTPEEKEQVKFDPKMTKFMGSLGVPMQVDDRSSTGADGPQPMDPKTGQEQERGMVPARMQRAEVGGLSPESLYAMGGQSADNLYGRQRGLRDPSPEEMDLMASQQAWNEKRVQTAQDLHIAQLGALRTKTNLEIDHSRERLALIEKEKLVLDKELEVLRAGGDPRTRTARMQLDHNFTSEYSDTMKIYAWNQPSNLQDWLNRQIRGEAVVQRYIDGSKNEFGEAPGAHAAINKWFSDLTPQVQSHSGKLFESQRKGKGLSDKLQQDHFAMKDMVRRMDGLIRSSGSVDEVTATNFAYMCGALAYPANETASYLKSYGLDAFTLNSIISRIYGQGTSTIQEDQYGEPVAHPGTSARPDNPLAVEDQSDQAAGIIDQYKESSSHKPDAGYINVDTERMAEDASSWLGKRYKDADEREKKQRGR